MKQKIIYMLDYGISQDFIYQLGWELRKYSYILIPMSPKDLASHLGKNKTRFPILSFVKGKDHLLSDISFKKRFLFHAINNLKLEVIEFSSFTELLDRYFITGRKKIKQYPLPIELNDAARLINESCKKFFEENKKWPGGMRGAIKQLGDI